MRPAFVARPAARHRARWPRAPARGSATGAASCATAVVGVRDGAPSRLAAASGVGRAPSIAGISSGAAPVERGVGSARQWPVRCARDATHQRANGIPAQRRRHERAGEQHDDDPGADAAEDALEVVRDEAAPQPAGESALASRCTHASPTTIGSSTTSRRERSSSDRSVADRGGRTAQPCTARHERNEDGRRPAEERQQGRTEAPAHRPEVAARREARPRAGTDWNSSAPAEEHGEEQRARSR